MNISAFLLAKVNATADAGPAARRSFLPTVMVIKEGQPIDGFQGAQPESAVREMLDKHLPSPQAGALVEAEQLLKDGDIPGALALYRSAWEESGKKLDMTLVYAGALVAAKRLDDAETLLRDIRLADQDSRYEQLMAQIELGLEAARSPEVEALEAAIEANPDDHATRIQLAIQLSQAAQYREALEHLLTVLRADKEFNDGEPRKVFLDTLATIGKGDPLAAEYQRKLFSLMY